MITTKRKLVFTGIVLITIISIYLGSTSQNSTSQLTNVRVGIATWPGFAAGMVGNVKGFFPGLNVSYDILDDPSARHAAFHGGQDDIMISSADVFAQEV